MCDLLAKLESVSAAIGNTPCVPLVAKDARLFAKLELCQLSGSAKIRPAFRILREAIRHGKLHEQSVVIESTSGNFGLALAHLCSRLSITFIPVLDPNIPLEKELLLRQLCAHVEKVTTIDSTGGYLLTRLAKVKSLMEETNYAFNPNQYENPDNRLSYRSMGDEVLRQVRDLRRVFISVSSGGCVAGLSSRLKEFDPQIKIIAVDVLGSQIFCASAGIRHLSGIGASFRTNAFDEAKIDEIVILSEQEIIAGTRALVREQGVVLGASSGAAYQVARQYCLEHPDLRGSDLIVCPDDGRDYQSSVYNDEWVNRLTGHTTRL